MGVFVINVIIMITINFLELWLIVISMNNSSKKVTVFTSSYNHGKYLPKAIESVLNQNFTDYNNTITKYARECYV
jgi:hypothetical protein